MTPRRPPNLAAVVGAAAALALVFDSSPAGAVPVSFDEAGFRVDVPADWPEVPELGEGVVANLRKNARIGRARLLTGGGAYASSAQGVALYVLWIVTEDRVDEPGLRVRRQLDAMNDRARAASLDAGDVKVDSWKEDVGARVASGLLVWRHVTNETRTLARALIFVDREGRLHEARVECVLRDDAAAALQRTCEQALASLAVTVPEAEQAPLGTIPGQGAVTVLPDGSEEPPSIEITDGADAGPLALETPRMAPAGAHVVPMAPPPAAAARTRQTTRLLLWGGGGLIVLAAVLYATRARWKAD